MIAPEVIQCASQLYNIVVVVCFSIAKHVFHDSATLDSSNYMLHNDTNPGDKFILLFFLAGEFSTTRFLLRLMNVDTHNFMALKSRVSVKIAPFRQAGAFFVADFFIVLLAFISIA